jgi:hypothetical protein
VLPLEPTGFQTITFKRNTFMRKQVALHLAGYSALLLTLIELGGALAKGGKRWG